jgi:predicted enzyme related to lactoylglutathione lyase
MSDNTKNSPELVHWFEIPVNDLAKSAKFYEALFDAPLINHNDNGKVEALVPNGSGTAPCGSLFSDPRRPTQPGSGVILYFLARGGVKRTLHRVVEAGGKVVKPATSIAPNGTIALVADLDGNVIGLHEEP